MINDSDKSQKFLRLFAVIGLIGCASALIPAVRSEIIAIIAFCESHILHRQISEEIWNYRNYRLLQIVISGLFVSMAVLFFSLRKLSEWDDLRVWAKGGALIFIYLIFCLIADNPPPGNIDGHTLSAYLLSYRQGFSSRMFIGTIVDFLVGGGFITQKFIWAFIVSASILYCFFLSVLLGYLIEHEEKMRGFVILLVALYLSCFTSPAAYFVPGNFGRLDMYALIFILGAVVLLEKPGWRWSVPILCLFSIATHLVVIFFYMPLIFILLLYKLFENDSPDKNTKRLFITTVGIIVLSSVYFILFSKNTLLFNNEQAWVNYLMNRTDAPTIDSSLHFEFFLSMRGHFEYAQNTIKESKIFPGVFSVLMNIPVFTLFAYFWKQCIANEHRKTMKLVFILSVLAPIISIPAFMFFIDWGRWVIMIMTSQFILVFYFLYKRETSVLYASEILLAAEKRHHFAFVLTCFLMLCIGPIWQIGISPRFIWLLKVISSSIASLI